MSGWSPRRPEDTFVVDWFAQRTNARPYGDNPWVQDSVGPDWPAYARIFCEPFGGTTWAETAERNGATMHALAEWEKISRPAGPNSPNRDRDEGFLSDTAWRALCRILAGETTSASKTYCLIWDVRDPRHYPELAHLHFVTFQGMTCWLAEAPLDEIATLEGWDQPDYLWPADQAWSVMAHYDFEYVVVGGARSLVDALVAAPELEAYEVPADARWGDTIN